MLCRHTGVTNRDVYGNELIAFRAAEAGVLTAYDGDGKALGRVEVSASHAGWHEFKAVRDARSYVFAPGK